MFGRVSSRYSIMASCKGQKDLEKSDPRKRVWKSSILMQTTESRGRIFRSAWPISQFLTKSINGHSVHSVGDKTRTHKSIVVLSH